MSGKISIFGGLILKMEVEKLNFLPFPSFSSLSFFFLPFPSHSFLFLHISSFSFLFLPFLLFFSLLLFPSHSFLFLHISSLSFFFFPFLSLFSFLLFLQFKDFYIKVFFVLHLNLKNTVILGVISITTPFGRKN